MMNNITLEEYKLMQKKIKLYEAMYGPIIFDDDINDDNNDDNKINTTTDTFNDKEQEINPMAIKLNYTSELTSIMPQIKDNVTECIYVEKTNQGERTKRFPSTLGESYVIIDVGKNIEELSKVEQQSICAQDDLHMYLNKKGTLDGAINAVGYGTSLLGIAKYVIPFL